MNFVSLKPKARFGILILGVSLLGFAYVLKPTSAADVELAKLEAPIKLEAMQQKIRETESLQLNALAERKVDRKLRCILELRVAVGQNFVNLRSAEFLELVAKTCP
jgi:hypothetical protein